MNGKIGTKLREPKELINYTCKMACNLEKMWGLGNFYQKQMFQSTLFTSGLVYDPKIEHYRTTVINSVICENAELARVLAEMKNRTSQNLIEKSGFVPIGDRKSNQIPSSIRKISALRFKIQSLNSTFTQ